ncbi:MAG: endonuclease NucS [Candidatus Bathyarchaeia archaeon]
MLYKPTLQEVADNLRHALAQRKCIIILGTCQVEYKGRTRSSLTSGERIVLIKSDGAVLVHRPTGHEPVNWQPSNSIFRTYLSESYFTLDAVRREPPESLMIKFTKVNALTAAVLSDVGEFTLHVSESEMRQAIIAEPTLLLSNFKPISFEKKVEPGFIDVYGVDSEGRLVVVELKRVRASKSAVLQLSKYVNYLRAMTNGNVRGILAAPGLLRGAHKLLATLGLEFVQVDLERFARIAASCKEMRIVDFLN